MPKSICFFFVFIFTFGCTFGQSDEPVLVLGAGSASYLGELNPYNTPLRSLFGPAVRWHFSVAYEQPIVQRVRLRTEFNYARIFGDDHLMENVRGKELNYLRNLHFRNDIKELAILGIYDLSNVSTLSYYQRPALSFYALAGVAVLFHNPVAKAVRDAPDEKSDWVNLRPLQTEGETYSKMAVAFPLGIGMRYRLNRHWGLGFEMSYRMTLTDYLDDVSTNFLPDSQEQLANRSLELTAAYSGKDRSEWLVNYLQKNGYPGVDAVDIPFFFPTGIPPFDVDSDPKERGNPHVKDSYVLGKLSLVFFISPKIKCPKLK
jgi:Domain of unknown function (DUF6089)